MLPRLVSSKICPFVQRALILLLEKSVQHEVTYIDLANKPQWFLEQSPRGKVPILIVEGVALFESQAICEYLDETCGGVRLTPEDPIQRARDRAWFPFAGEDLFGAAFRLMIATTEEQYLEQRADLRARLERLAREKKGAWLSGDGSRFGLADVAVAPLFTRLALFGKLTGSDWLEDVPSLADYARKLLVRPAVAASVPDDFEAVMLAFLTQKKSLLLAERS
jgi:glutathione S-transferase